MILKENKGVNPKNPSVPNATHAQLHAHIQALIAARGGWLPFDDFMHAALYAPGMGYYTGGLQKLGAMPSSGSDFVTAPELSPLFGQCLADQAAQVLQATDTHSIYEFGAGSGALALHICEHLAQHSCRLDQYFIIEISSELRARQQDALKHLGNKVVWLDALPEQMQGVILGNEVLDAMPVKLLQRTAGVWHERGIVLTSDGHSSEFAWQDRPTALRPPLEIPGVHDYLTEIHPQNEAFLRTLAERLALGAAFFIDYGFPEAEYYHPQRFMGTVMTHYLHQADPDPLDKVGLKDITAHVNFTGAALAAQEAGLDVLGYATQGRFLLNCGLLSKAEQLALMPRAQVAKLINEHEMGELFKVLALGKGLGLDLELIGFAQGDRSHTL
jgi:SAM-dependent MidA family methyltransferase